MFEIVLFVIKAAGITVVSILGILIALAACVLFVPVRYRGDLQASSEEDGGKKAVCAKCRASWLFSLVSVHAAYEGGFRAWVKIFGFTLFDTGRAEESLREKTEKRKKEKREETGQREQKEQKENIVEPEFATKDQAGAEPKFINILQTIRNFCGRLKRIKDMAEKIKDAAEKLKDKTEQAKALWEAPHMARARGLAWKEILYLLGHTKPKKVSGYLRFGFDDPSFTGYAMAAYGILRPIWSLSISVEPDFEDEALDCCVAFQGKVRTWHFAWAAVRLFFSKDVRRAVRDVKKFLKENR